MFRIENCRCFVFGLRNSKEEEKAMLIGEYVYTRRFRTVRIGCVFEDEKDSIMHGYTEEAHCEDSRFGVKGKLLPGSSNMVFAAYKKNKRQ